MAASLRKRITCVERVDSFFSENLCADIGIEDVSIGFVDKDADLREDTFDGLGDSLQKIGLKRMSNQSEDNKNKADQSEDDKSDDAESAGETSDEDDNALADNDIDVSVSNSGDSTNPAFTERQHPHMSIMLNLGQRTLERLIYLQLGWLKHYGWVHESQGEWIYGILACLQKPLESSVISDLREIAKYCRATRLSIWKSKAKYDEGPCKDLNHDNFISFLNTMNLFICIVGDYFQQRDLADELLD